MCIDVKQHESLLVRGGRVQQHGIPHLLISSLIGLLIVKQPCRRQARIVRFLPLYILYDGECLLWPVLIHVHRGEQEPVFHLAWEGVTQPLHLCQSTVGQVHITIHSYLLHGDLLAESLPQLPSLQGPDGLVVVAHTAIYGHQLLQYVIAVLLQQGESLQQGYDLLSILPLQKNRTEDIQIHGIVRISAASLLHHLQAHAVRLQQEHLHETHRVECFGCCGVYLQTMVEEFRSRSHIIGSHTTGSLQEEVVKTW